MHFIEHHHTIGQTPQAHEVVLDIERGEQRLIDRSNPVWRQQWTLALGKPRGSRQAFAAGMVDFAQMQHVFVHRRAAVNQLHLDRAFGEAVKERQCPLEHRVAGRLRRQRHIQSAMIVGRLQAQMRNKSQFGLAFTHRGFHEQQRRTFRVSQQAVSRLLQRSGCKPFPPYDAREQCRRVRWCVEQRSRRPPTDMTQRFGRQAKRMLVVIAKIVMAFAKCKPLRIRGDPVRRAGQTGQPVHGRQAQFVECRRTLWSQHLPVSAQDRIARSSPIRRLIERFGTLHFFRQEVISMVRADGLDDSAQPAGLGTGQWVQRLA